MDRIEWLSVDHSRTRNTLFQGIKTTYQSKHRDLFWKEDPRRTKEGHDLNDHANADVYARISNVNSLNAYALSIPNSHAHALS
jgi:hypothetical protein